MRRVPVGLDHEPGLVRRRPRVLLEPSCVRVIRQHRAPCVERGDASRRVPSTSHSPRVLRSSSGSRARWRSWSRLGWRDGHRGVLHGDYAAHRIDDCPGVGEELVQLGLVQSVEPSTGVAYAVRSPAIWPLWSEASELARRFSHLSFEWVRRTQNKEADALTRKAYAADVAAGRPDLWLAEAAS